MAVLCEPSALALLFPAAPALGVADWSLKGGPLVRRVVVDTPKVEVEDLDEVVFGDDFVADGGAVLVG